MFQGGTPGISKPLSGIAFLGIAFLRISVVALIAAVLRQRTKTDSGRCHEPWGFIEFRGLSSWIRILGLAPCHAEEKAKKWGLGLQLYLSENPTAFFVYSSRCRFQFGGWVDFI